MKNSLMTAHARPELRLEKVINELQVLIYDEGMTFLIPQYNELINQYNGWMEN